jgi:hypothetical protein
MMRQMIPLVLLGTALVPDWATAIGKRCTPQYPVYWTPTCPQPVVILPPCLPSYEIIPQQVAPQLAPPTVTPETAKPEPAKPEPAKPDPVAPPKSPMPGIPRTSAEPPVIERVAAPVPAVPEAKPVIIPVTAITVPETKANTPEAPVKIPTLVPRIPGGDNSLPPLIVPTPSESTSKSSPLTSRAVELIPVSGDAPSSPEAFRTVNIFNYTERDLKLTVQGQSITLPKRSFVTANVPRKFDWKFDENPKQTTEIPVTSPGLEIVIRR